MKTKCRPAALFLAVIITLVAYSPLSAADYPSRPITLINPNAPGGIFDSEGRVLATVMEKILGQPLVMLNKPGAGNMVGCLAGAQAEPDGYTVTMISSGTTNGIEWEIANGRKPSFTRHDYTCLGSYTFDSPFLLVAADSPWKTFSDFINACKAKPRFYAFSSGGLFGGSHIPAEILIRAAGIKARHVPYQGGGPALTALVGKHVDFSVQYAGPSVPLVKGNKLRALAVMGEKRAKVLPDVPTVKELGVEEGEYYTWIGLGVPRSTPREIVEKLRAALAKAVKEKVFIDAMENLGEEIYYLDGDRLAKYWDQESGQTAKLMAELAREAGAK